MRFIRCKRSSGDEAGDVDGGGGVGSVVGAATMVLIMGVDSILRLFGGGAVRLEAVTVALVLVVCVELSEE